MYAIKAEFDGTNIMAKEPIPVNEPYEAVVMFTSPKARYHTKEKTSQERGSFESGLDFAGIFDSDREDAFIIEQLKADARRKTEERLAEWEKTGVDPLTRFSGCFKDIFPEGGLEYQRTIRDEWPD